MLILRSSSASPFGRKIKIAATVLGFANRIEVQMAKTTDPEDSLRQQNPLGKIPTLVLEDGTALFDSPVITEYLDYLAGGEKLLPAGAERFDVLTKQAMADGIVDAAILIVYERRFRPAEKVDTNWLSYQQDKIDRSLNAFEANPLPHVSHGSPDAAQIALACALGYLDFRLGGEWREGRDKLVGWLDDFAASVPSFEATQPHD
ncbi:glutathione S-transferase family protein [Pseudovibrio sp. SPO723]|uniref:glutathione S-transferase family protein n=1 Tax=Nesiotobacter zosterae TaxID=392721 RepID=UPI0029C3CEE7|nr:glutathione S-transferase family protein [Pseudovibrio sp. SPO723]MDX5593933.1 glutathione S-transferase family protein [Pseudovibrio sp. SPO723]